MNRSERVAGFVKKALLNGLNKRNTRQPMKLSMWIFLWSVCFGLVSNVWGLQNQEPVKIGVLAFRSEEKTLQRWSPTARHLETVVAGTQFKIIPMNYPQVNEAVASRTVEFVLTNTGHYVELEATHGIARIATLVKSVGDNAIKVFGGVIFTRFDRNDIQALDDLKGKSFLAVKKSSLGGFLVAWEQFEKQGIDPFADFSNLAFNGMPHDDVVLKVLAGQYDAGTVRTSVLEQMLKEGSLKQGDIKIINRKTTQGFPYIHSTALYPEWPLSRLPHTDDDLVEKVTVALLHIKRGDPAAVSGGYDRWSPPLDYHDVHTMFKVLKAGPYQDSGTFTLKDVLYKYLEEIVFIGIIFFVGVLALVRIAVLNRRLNKAYSEVRTLQGLIPICSSCKKIRDDTGFWNQLESYIEQHSHALFSHGICPSCTEALYGKEPWYKDLSENQNQDR